jgi:tripartite-type tricarboxylate transporter receptor subunit TctC
MRVPQVAYRALLGAVMLLAPAVATAQTGTIRVVVGTAPGGAIDPYARMIADKMQKFLGQPVIIENKPGASGSLAAQSIADQPADGNILWLGTQAFTEILPNLFPNAHWSIDQFHPIVRGVVAPLVFDANPSLPANSFAEFLTWAKANKGKESYCSYQPGTPSHFLGYQLNDKFGLDLTHVPYRGSGLQATALLSGECKFGFAQLNSTLQYLNTSKLKALATTGPKRDRAIPNVPTFAELGYPEFTATVWFGLLVKEGTPPAVLKRLTDAATAAHNDSEVRKKLESQGFEVTAETGPQLKTQIKEQIVRWGKLVKASGWSVQDRGATK